MNEKNFSLNFRKILSLIVWATYILMPQEIVLQNIFLTQVMWILDQQKEKKSLVIDSDTKSEIETQGAGEDIIDV